MQGVRRGVLYMVTEDNEFELPLMVSDTVTEIAQRYGLPRASVSSAISKGAHISIVRGPGKRVYVRVYRINTESEEDE